MAEYIKTLTNKARTDSIYPRTLATAVEMGDRETTIEEEITNLYTTKLDKSLTKQLSTEDYTSADKNKLTQIPETAEENQFAFSYIQEGTNPPIAATSKMGTLKVEAGANVSLTLNAATNTMTIAATGEIGTEAANTGIEDLGDYYTGTNVEVALQEIGYTLGNLAVTGDLVTLEDLGEYYPVHNVEDALQQVGSSLAAKAPINNPTFTGTVGGITATMIGLGNVTNESKATMFASAALTGTSTAPTATTGTNTTQIASTAFVQQEITANAYVHPNHTGDVTSVADGVTTITNKAVTLAKMADISTGSILGRVTTATGVPEVLTPTQVRTLLNVADGANNYVLPAATSSTLGGVKVSLSGTTLTITTT